MRFHYYVEENEKRKVVSIILRIARKKEYENLKWYMKRDWKYGPHIGIYLFHQRGDGKLENDFLKKIRYGVETYWEESPKVEVVMPDEQVLRQLAQLEKYQKYSSEEYLPIQPHCSCIKETISLKQDGYYSTRKEYLFYQKKRIACRYLLLDTVEALQKMDKEKQYLFLTTIFWKVAECYPKEGLLRGCLSFKSHVTGFLGNADRRTVFLQKRFEQIYEYMKEDLKLLEEKKYDFGDAQELIKQWKLFFNVFIEEIYFNKGLQNKLKKDSDFAEKSIENLSGFTEFHHNWVKRDTFVDFFFSEEFYRYRILVNFFYLLLPSLGFGPSDKHLGCYLITRTIEETKGLEFMNMISA